ncbi:MAG: hypothetical protein M3336_02600 [Chloroflexota bacterium]|nr:hypothetical protein [Chloroflexota bacterium]
MVVRRRRGLVPEQVCAWHAEWAAETETDGLDLALPGEGVRARVLAGKPGAILAAARVFGSEAHHAPVVGRGPQASTRRWWLSHRQGRRVLAY